MLKRILIVGLVCLVRWVPMVSAQESFNIDFPGGPLIELVDEITNQNDGYVPNIMISAEARNAEIPPIQLVGITLGDLMRALEYMYLPLGINDISDDVWAINGDFVTGEVRIHSVRNLLDPNNAIHFKVDDIATAIRTAWDMTPCLVEPTMKVHVETGLLIIQGDEDRQVTARQVLEQLSDQQRWINYRKENESLKRELSSLKDQCQNHDESFRRLISEKEYLDQTMQEQNSRLNARITRLEDENAVLRQQLRESQKAQ